MGFIKKVKDRIIKLTLGDSVPKGLFELSEYFRKFGAIQFEIHKEDGFYVAVSKNFRFGSIVTSAEIKEELDTRIEDAILTTFSVPSVYAKKAGLRKTGDSIIEYAPA